jgi:hypothetical protein
MILTDSPAHVPPELVYDYDYINDPALLADPHARIRVLVQKAPPIFYSRLYGGHWVVTRKQDLLAITADPGTFSNKSRGIPPSARISSSFRSHWIRRGIPNIARRSMDIFRPKASCRWSRRFAG